MTGDDLGYVDGTTGLVNSVNEIQHSQFDTVTLHLVQSRNPGTSGSIGWNSADLTAHQPHLGGPLRRASVLLGCALVPVSLNGAAVVAERVHTPGYVAPAVAAVVARAAGRAGSGPAPEPRSRFVVSSSWYACCEATVASDGLERVDRRPSATYAVRPRLVSTSATARRRPPPARWTRSTKTRARCSNIV